MNHLILSASVHDNELRYTKDRTPICALKLGYEFHDRKETKQAELKAVAQGDWAEKVHLACPKGAIAIFQGTWEMWGDGEKRSWQFSLNRVPTIVSNLFSLNRLYLVGRLGKDPNLKFFESGAVQATFSLAVNRGKEIPADWHQCEVWGQRAETIGNYARKGSLIGLETSLFWWSWRDRETGARTARPVARVEQVDLLGRSSSQEAA